MEVLLLDLGLVLLGVGPLVEYIVFLVESVLVILFLVKESLGVIFILVLLSVIVINILSELVSVVAEAFFKIEGVVLMRY